MRDAPINILKRLQDKMTNPLLKRDTPIEINIFERFVFIPSNNIELIHSSIIPLLKIKKKDANSGKNIENDKMVLFFLLIKKTHSEVNRIDIKMKQITWN